MELAASSWKPEDFQQSNGPYRVNWRRVILDEGHIIRNPASKGAAAVTALQAHARWVLFGTPIVNSPKDLYGILRSVGVSGGLEQLPVCNIVLARPLKTGDPSATYLLQAVMRTFTLLRRKEMAFIDLKLPQLEDLFTPALETEAKGLLKDYQKKGRAGGQAATSAYNNLLEVILRMRQCCNHWQLRGERATKLLAQLQHQQTGDLTPENVKALQNVLQVLIESSEGCAVCLETLHDPVITTCGHFFGRECISKVIETQHRSPMCRAELKDETVLVSPAHEGEDEEADDQRDLTQSSSKLEARMEILGATKAKNEKTIVFIPGYRTEERDLVVQAEKRELMKLGFSEKAGKREKVKKSRMADIQMLLGPSTQPASNGSAAN
ncbi:hypothetical protein LTR62_003558 [Meristemomyces frigidus]|uniref:RING-type domain-containing protein n=1 Tax=Meristemomyces frigidus TaxID=1508187 RepID=A0AAN7YGS9_9PEZI|nr:hypothetical protein LTR62_003558 [Meristemomyces frigidus]